MFIMKRSRTQAFLFKRELILLALTGAILFIGIALYSYNPHDPSWFFHSSDVHTITNHGGKMGANIAGLLFYLLGLASFLILPFLLFISYLVLQQRKYEKEWERIAAFVALIITFSALCSLHGFDVHHTQMPGGYVGYMVNIFLVRLFERVGAILLLYTSLQICFVVLFRFSFIQVVQYTVAQSKKIYAFCVRHKVAQRSYALLRMVVLYAIIKPLILFSKFGMKILDGSAFERKESESQSYGFSRSESVSYQVPVVLREAIDRKQLYEAPPVEETFKEQENFVRDESEAVDYPQELFSQNEIAHEIPSEEESPRYGLPSLDIFIGVEGKQDDKVYRQALQERAHILEEKLERFGVCGKVTSIKNGPVVTLFEYQPEIDTKLSKILSLEDDLALALQALSIRIIAPIPGRAVVGFEVSNKNRKNVLLANVIQSQEYQDFNGQLALILGEDTIGNNVIVDLAKMPHLLVAGSTGSGKSVALNTMLISLLCKCTPDDLKLILIDPKRLEFAPYADIAHLLFPIITDPRRAAPVLRWVVKQMERRYEKMSIYGSRNMADYNAQAEQTGDEHFPFIVVVIDELSDLMLTVGREIEDLITRITQMARAAGIHMIIATQRPSVDVITGLIKVNFPSRISFRVTSKADSRTILDCGGADKLLGRGDSLFLDSTNSTLNRVHGAYVSDREIEEVVTHIKSQQPVEYLDLNEELRETEEAASGDKEELLDEVLEFLHEVEEVSISLLQRRFRIGYNRSARIIDMLESRGLIMPADGTKTRRVIR